MEIDKLIDDERFTNVFILKMMLCALISLYLMYATSIASYTILKNKPASRYSISALSW